MKCALPSRWCVRASTLPSSSLVNSWNKAHCMSVRTGSAVGAGGPVQIGAKAGELPLADSGVAHAGEITRLESRLPSGVLAALVGTGQRVVCSRVIVPQVVEGTSAS